MCTVEYISLPLVRVLAEFPCVMFIVVVVISVDPIGLLVPPKRVREYVIILTPNAFRELFDHFIRFIRFITSHTHTHTCVYKQLDLRFKVRNWTYHHPTEVYPRILKGELPDRDIEERLPRFIVE